MISDFFILRQTSDRPSVVAHPDFDFATEQLLLECKRIANWPSNASITMVSTTKDFPDFPWWFASGTLASSRFVKIIKTIVPDDAQILPVKVTIDGIDDDFLKQMPKYFIINWLREIDCLNTAMSDMDYSLSRPFARNPIISPERVPQDAIIFRATYDMQCVYVRKTLPDLLTQHKITGWRVEPAAVE